MSGDCCKKLEAELREIRKLVSGLNQADYMKKSEFLGQLEKWLLPTGVALGMATTGDLASLRANLDNIFAKTVDVAAWDKEIVRENQRLHKGAKEALDNFRKQAEKNYALKPFEKVAEQAQSTASKAASKADDARNLAQKGFDTAKNAFTKANGAFVKATTAIENINVFGSRLGSLFGIATQALSLAGTAISLYANFVNLRSINALERRIDSIEVGVQTSISLASRGIFMARRLEGELANIRNGLYAEIERVGFTATQGLQKAFQAIEKSAQAFAGAQKALAVGIQASAEAQGAVAQAIAAEQSAQGANAKAVQSAIVAGVAGALAGKALDAAFSAGRQAQTAASAASAATAKADTIARELPPLRQRVAQAIGLSEMARSRAGNAERIANQALQKAGKPGPRGLQGIPGRDGRPGRDGKPGLQGKPGTNGLPGPAGKPGLAGKPGKDGKAGLNGKDGKDGKDAPMDPTIKPLLLQIKGAQQAHIGQSRVNGVQSRQAAAASTVASVQATQANTKIGAVQGTVNSLKTTAQQTFELAKRTGKFLGIDRMLNFLTLFVTIHNAAMLSGQLGATLGELVSQGLAVVGIKDVDNNPIDINQALGRSFQAFLVSVVGQENYVQLSTTWAKASRVYQAAANVLSTLSSIQQATLSAVEIVSSQSSKIGNALRAYGAVGERAYDWMNPNPNYDNRFFTALQQAEDGASMVLGVTGDILSAQEQMLQLEKDKLAFRETLKGVKEENGETVQLPEGFPKPANEPKGALEAARKAFVESANITPDTLKGEEDASTNG